MSSEFSKLPLQKKVTMTLLLTIMAFAAFSYVILSEVIAPAFEDVELQAARTDLVRADRALRADMQNLDAIAADWALWDDIYSYAQGRNPAFYASNLERPTLTNLGIDLMAVYDRSGRLLWGDTVIDGEDHAVSELGILGVGDPALSLLVRHQNLNDKVSGIVRTNLGPMIISARPLLKSDNSGPIAGSLVVAQYLNESRMNLLKERTELQLRWVDVEEFLKKADFDAQQLALDETHIEVRDRTISSHEVLTDIFGAPVLVLSTESPRRISMLGAKTVNAAMTFLLLAGVLVAVVMWYLLRRIILRPIDLLAAHMDRIRESGDLSQVIQSESDDEIGALARQFNRLTSEVHDARKALLYQSFKAGKADTAAEVLHNIRNAMTPMINGVERLTRATHVSDDLRVPDAVVQLRDRSCPPERTEKLIDYVEASFEHIKKCNAESADDVKIVMSQARQIEAILSDQEKFANAAPPAESVSVHEVIGEAAYVIPKEARKAVEVALDADLARFRVQAHRVGLLQVMGNLILNAYESIQRASREHGHIQLSAKNELLDDRPMIRLTVRDNGTGFEADIRNRVFQRGYTSKGEGDTTGLGLHWCANAVAGMGGRISAESDGVDSGAEFHVLLPAAQGG
jgi:two-component system NtrC family sensor kinase